MFCSKSATSIGQATESLTNAVNTQVFGCIVPSPQPQNEVFQINLKDL